jgi:transcriptional regulator with XRE-family HTH domain
MDAIRIGAVCRALRINKRWRQSDVANRAGVPRLSVSALERGRVGELRVDVVVSIVEALGGHLNLIVQYQGGELDRLINARHSALHESVARSFLGSVWVLAPEVSFAYYSERGIIDILAWHAPTRSLLVIELKTDVVDINELLGTVDRKLRLAARVARERGWNAASVSVWVIVADSVTNRRRVANHLTVLRAALPLDGRAIRPWLRAPRDAIRCLSFWSNARLPNTKSGLATVKRVRRPKAVAARA